MELLLDLNYQWNHILKLRPLLVLKSDKNNGIFFLSYPSFILLEQRSVFIYLKKFMILN